MPAVHTTAETENRTRRNQAPAPRRLLQDIVSVLSTRAAWTVMGMITGVILARKLGPHDRGILALVLLLPSTVTTLAKLGMSQSNVYFINRRGEPPERVASNTAAIALSVGGLAAAIVWSLQGVLLKSVLREVEPWALALALVRVPLLLLDNHLYGVLQATGRFNLYNLRLVLSETLRMLLVIAALLVLKLGLFAAVIIETGVTAINVCWLVLATQRHIPFRPRFHRDLLAPQFAFGLKSYVQTLTAHLLLRIDVYMVSYFLGASETAFYSLALRFTEMVLEIPQAVGLVLYPRLAALPREEIYNLTAQACRRTLLLSALGALGIGILGPYVIVLWYGRPYAPAGAPLPWAAVGVMAMSAYVILTRAFTSQNRQQVNIATGLLALASNIALNLFLIPRLGIVGAAMATAISYSLATAVLMGVYLAASGSSLGEVLIATREDIQFFAGAAWRVLLLGWRLVGLSSAPAGR